MTLSLIEPKIRCARAFTDRHEERDGDIPRHLVSASLLLAPCRPLLLAAPKRRKTLLLASRDAALASALRHTASLADLAFQQITDANHLAPLENADQTAAVLVDLDLPDLEGWKIAETFLASESGPPLVLLTGRTGHFDLGLAICAGMVLGKSSCPTELHRYVSDLLAKPETAHESNRARHRLLVRWLRPCDWTAPVATVHRHWGLND